MSEVRYKLGPKQARECLAALVPISPWFAKDALLKMLEGLNEKGDVRGIDIRISRVARKHTDSQSGYYWMALGMFAKAQGDSPDALHEIILAEAFGSKPVQFSGNGIVYRVPVKRSAKLGIEDYSHLIETLLQCAAFAGVVLPDPQAVA